MHKILAMNPGSTSTKIGWFDGEECTFKENIKHPEQELAVFPSVMDQVAYRCNAVLGALHQKGLDITWLTAIVVRGGLLRPLAGGIYVVDDEMVAELDACRFGIHASNLGGVMALPLGKKLGIPVFTVDPVTVDEFDDVARYSGLKGIERLSMSHALNMKAVARQAAAKMGRTYEEINLVVAHLGSGISVSAHRRGRMVDVNNANNEGPFSLERTGTLPALALINLCFDGSNTAREMKELVTARGGIYSYLGTKDFREVVARVAAGDIEAQRVVAAMAYQVSKEVGAMAAVLAGDVDLIILTGGMANAVMLTDLIQQKVSYIAQVQLFPGEEELESLAQGALRALCGIEKAKVYGQTVQI